MVLTWQEHRRRLGRGGDPHRRFHKQKERQAQQLLPHHLQVPVRREDPDVPNPIQSFLNLVAY